jgi:hypothetical protein
MGTTCGRGSGGGGPGSTGAVVAGDMADGPPAGVEEGPEPDDRPRGGDGGQGDLPVGFLPLQLGLGVAEGPPSGRRRGRRRRGAPALVGVVVEGLEDLGVVGSQGGPLLVQEVPQPPGVHLEGPAAHGARGAVALRPHVPDPLRQALGVRKEHSGGRSENPSHREKPAHTLCRGKVIGAWAGQTI